MAEQRGAVVPVHARDDQAVEIHWRRADGTVFVERRTCPPKATVDVRIDSRGEPER